MNAHSVIGALGAVLLVALLPGCGQMGPLYQPPEPPEPPAEPEAISPSADQARPVATTGESGTVESP